MPAVARAPTNIAIVKYWGKNSHWEDFHIPAKSSLSFAVANLHSETRVEAKKGNGRIEFKLNGKYIDAAMPEHAYVKQFFEKCAKIYPFLKRYDFSIESANNFPTSAGFASSASGFAALTLALTKELEDEFEDACTNDAELSAMARLGSGSAARSVPKDGGLVVWKRGIGADVPFDERRVSEVSASSYAETIVKADALSDLSIIYTRINEGEKKIKSRAGMKTTVQTNPLYWNWVEYEERIALPKMIEQARKKEWNGLFENIMKCSSGLHAAMLYTHPSIIYLNDMSKKIIDLIYHMNEEHGKTISAYTFDAGPNAVLFTIKDYEKEVSAKLKRLLGDGNIITTHVGDGPEYVQVGE